jgi:hypothetical protein
MSDPTTAIQLPPKVCRSGLVTLAGIFLFLLGGLDIASVLYIDLWPLWTDVDSQKTAFISAYPMAQVVSSIVLILAGFATVKRWRGWRIWVGTVAWLMIGFSAIGVASAPLLYALDYKESERERLLFAASFAAIAFLFGCLGLFTLAAKREEPTSDEGTSTAVIVAGAILVLIGVLLLAGGVAVAVYPSTQQAPSGELVGSIFMFMLATLFGYAGTATIWRWKHWRGFSKTLSWMVIVVLLLFGLAAIISGPPTPTYAPVAVRISALIWLGMLLAPLVFVLWALRQASGSKAA